MHGESLAIVYLYNYNKKGTHRPSTVLINISKINWWSSDFHSSQGARRLIHLNRKWVLREYFGLSPKEYASKGQYVSVWGNVGPFQHTAFLLLETTVIAWINIFWNLSNLKSLIYNSAAGLLPPAFCRQRCGTAPVVLLPDADTKAIQLLLRESAEGTGRYSGGPWNIPLPHSPVWIWKQNWHILKALWLHWI